MILRLRNRWLRGLLGVKDACFFESRHGWKKTVDSVGFDGRIESNLSPTLRLLHQVVCLLVTLMALECIDRRGGECMQSDGGLG